MADMFARLPLAMGWSSDLSIVLKSTVILGLTIVAIALARRARASARHLLLTSTFGTLLMLPAAVAVLPSLVVEIETSKAISAALPLLPAANARSVEPVTTGSGRSHPTEGHWAAVSAQTLFRIGWTIGAISFLAPVVGGLWRLRHLRRYGVPWLDREVFIRELSCDTGIRGSVEILLHEDVRSPATYGFTRPAVVFPMDAQEWSRPAVRQAMVHELEHVRRADWIVHLLARVVCALYWFHPFVWIAWRQLCLEAEHACDDAVLRGAERTQYAQQLVGLARRFSADAVRPVLSMLSRGDLSARVAAVLDTRRSRGRIGWLHGTVIVTTAVVVVMAIAPLRAVPVLSHQTTAANSAPPAFEVASVKLNKSGDVGMGIQASRGGLRARNVTLRLLIRTAYRIQDSELTGAPGWLDTERFDIVAKAEGNATPGQLSLMMQALLADRFKLMVHKETRERPIYSLIVARSDGRFGPQLQRRDCAPASVANTPGVGPPLPCERIETGAGRVTFRGAPMSQIAQGLSGYVGRVVLDRTGLSGNYDLTLEWTPELLPPANQPPGSDGKAIDPNSQSIFTAVQEQLGLKLQPTQGLVDVLVIDRVKHPTEN